MLFTNSMFWLFYGVVILLLQINLKFFKSIKIQNLVLLFGSYYFYAFWDLRFLALIIIVSLQTFLLGKLLCIGKNRLFYLVISTSINLLILGYFKYFNFFANEFINLFNLKDFFIVRNIILPVGISFYIFQSLTYVIDIYLKRIKDEKDIINYFTYISFFPQLVAGPIERASSLLPQFKTLKTISKFNFYLGIKNIISGLFLKVFIADNIADLVDLIFQNFKDQNGGTLILGSIYFSIQIYCDFFGYSLIAIGVAKILGFKLMNNFNTPYFASSLQEFWKRWHISLSSFFKDYVYIPLGGSKVKGNFLVSRNIFITFVLSGIWHGANWTFILWGIIHSFLLILEKKTKIFMPKLLGWIFTIFGVCILWILFRSENIVSFINYISIIFTDFGFPNNARSGIFLIFYFVIFDLILNKHKNFEDIWFNKLYVQNFIMSLMLALVFGEIGKNLNFIYFQF